MAQRESPVAQSGTAGERRRRFLCRAKRFGGGPAEGKPADWVSEHPAQTEQNDRGLAGTADPIEADLYQRGPVLKSPLDSRSRND